MTRREFLPLLGGGAVGYRVRGFPRDATVRWKKSVRCAGEMAALSGA